MTTSPHQVAQTKIWCYGPETDGANLVVDSTVGVQYLIEIKDPIRKMGRCFFFGWLKKLFFFGWFKNDVLDFCWLVGTLCVGSIRP